MEQKMVNGLTLEGIALTAAGLIQDTPWPSKWFLIVAAALLVILG